MATELSGAKVTQAFWEKRGVFIGWTRNPANPSYEYERGYYLPVGENRCAFIGRELPEPTTETLLAIWKDIEMQNLFMDFIEGG